MTIRADRARLTQVDNLRAGLVAWVIGCHALLGYSAIGGWAYDEVNEVSFRPDVELTLVVLLGASGLFVIGAFFFVAGLLTSGSVDRKGPRRFARDRLVRLGAPFLVSALLVWPATLLVAYWAAGRPTSYEWVLLYRDTPLDSGALWFAEVLLIFSLAYAGWRTIATGPRAPAAPLRARALVATAAALAATTFVVRLEFSARSTQFGDLHLWQWPQCAGMFLFGIAAGRRGWLRSVPPPLWRGSALVALTTVLALPLLAYATDIGDFARDVEPFLGGWTWQALVLAAVEGTLVVTVSIWLVGFAQRWLTSARTTRWTRAAFAAFVLQGPVLIGLALALRPTPWPAEAKAAVVAVTGVATCFWLGDLLVRRTPLGRVM